MQVFGFVFFKDATDFGYFHSYGFETLIYSILFSYIRLIWCISESSLTFFGGSFALI